jgi:hypothetical protein
MKLLAAIVLCIAVFIGAGVSGLSFYLWPTWLGDHPLNVTPAMLRQLTDLKREHKFGPDPARFYPGATDEVQRAAAQLAADQAIQALIDDLPKRPRRAVVLANFKQTLASFVTVESEERDELLHYLGRAMAICGVESSAELFNVWRYGFPYGWLLPG